MSRHRCFLAQFSRKPCHGQLVRAHLLKRQMLVRELPSKLEALGHSRREAMMLTQILASSARTWVWACGGLHGNAGHHGMLDHTRELRIPRHALPPDVEQFAAEYGLGWWLDREYGPTSRRDAA